MSSWECTRCSAEVEDTVGRREMRLKSRYVKGELAFCEECANVVFDRDTKRFRPTGTTINLREIDELKKQRRSRE